MSAAEPPSKIEAGLSLAARALSEDRLRRARRMELIVRCKELARFVRGFEEHAWADWLEGRVEDLRGDNLYCTRSLREGYAGLANISDLYLCSEAGHPVLPEDELGVNEQLLLMLAKVRQVLDSYEALIEDHAAL